MAGPLQNEDKVLHNFGTGWVHLLLGYFSILSPIDFYSVNIAIGVKMRFFLCLCGQYKRNLSETVLKNELLPN